jgi:hypothetical protein
MTFIPWEFLLTVFTHFLLFPTLYWTWKRRRFLWIEFSLFASIFFWSTLYHACQDGAQCLLSLQEHRRIDHFFAQLALPISILYLGCIDVPHIKGFYLVFLLHFNFFLQFVLEVEMKVNAFFLILFTFVSIVQQRFIHWYFWRQRLPPYDIVDAAFGFALGILSLLAFLSPTHGFTQYATLHSLWHGLSFIGSFFILEARNSNRTLFIKRSTWRTWSKFFTRQRNPPPRQFKKIA